MEKIFDTKTDVLGQNFFIAEGGRSVYLGSGWIVSRFFLLREENDRCTGARVGLGLGSYCVYLFQ